MINPLAKLYFEDFTPGRVFQYGERTISLQEMVDFATIVDPQPMHVDVVAARETFVRELIASGWHTISLQMRMIVDHILSRSSSMGAPGITSLKWLKPVLPGDTLRAECTVLDSRASNTKPDRGFATFKVEMINQRNEIVLEQIYPQMFARRPDAANEEPAPASLVSPKPAEKWYGATGDRPDWFTLAPYEPGFSSQRFDDLEIGTSVKLGSCHFPASEIIRFGTAFDPQPFHLDEEAGRNSHFGGLVASGWHTAAGWMRLMIENRKRSSEVLLASGIKPAELGPSPGFTDLRWLKPTYEGDTLNYHVELAEKRPTASRPAWGLVKQRNFANNQHGELVFEFYGNVFWQRT